MLTCVSPSIAGKAPVRKYLGFSPLDSYFKQTFTVSGLVFEFVEAKSSLDPDWEQWRTSMKGVVGGSDFASLVGHGWTSPRACLKEVLGIQPKKQPNGWAKTCMQHGKLYEKAALEVALEGAGYTPHSSVLPLKNLNFSVVYEYYSENDPSGSRLRVCLSPDYVDRYGHLIEVKCPYTGSSEFSTSREFAESIADRYGKGKGRESYFLQALFYSVILDSCVGFVPRCANTLEGFLGTLLYERAFGVAIGTVSNQDTLSVVWFPYRHAPGSSSIIWDNLAKILKCSTPCTVAAYRVTGAERQFVTNQMYCCALERCPEIFGGLGGYHVDLNGNLLEKIELEEQSEDSSGDNDPSPPWE